MRVTLMCITDGRWDYLRDTLASAEMHLDYPFVEKILVDDTGTGQAEHALKHLDGWRLVANPQRRGLAGAIQAGWDALCDTDYVFHLEDDFTMVGHIPVGDMVRILEAHPELAQLALLRQPWSPEEHQAGSIINMHRNWYHQADGYLWHTQGLFTLNPSVYPVAVTSGGAALEAELTDRLRDAGYRFGFYGDMDDGPRCWHIGIRRSQGYHW